MPDNLKLSSCRTLVGPAVSDGLIVGSTIVRLMEQATQSEANALTAIEQLVLSLSDAAG